MLRYQSQFIKLSTSLYHMPRTNGASVKNITGGPMTRSKTINLVESIKFYYHNSTTMMVYYSLVESIIEYRSLARDAVVLIFHRTTHAKIW